MAGQKVESTHLRRSLLFVPGTDVRKLERARESAADTLLLDLEDSVAPGRKAEARRNVAEALRAGGFGDREAAVRVNAPGSAEFEADLEAVISAGGRSILLPKAETPEGISRVVERLRALEAGAGDGSVRLLALVESPAGIANALAIGSATPRIEALCFGHADFSLAMGLATAHVSRGIAFHARCSLVIAAKACGVAPIDSVHLAVKDEEGLRAEAELGRELGFEGKLCIHPRQVEIVNAVYTPGVAEIEFASRVIEASERAEAEGRGVFTLDGKMVDAPVVAAQRKVLERARRASAR